MTDALAENRQSDAYNCTYPDCQNGNCDELQACPPNIRAAAKARREAMKDDGLA